MKFRSVFLRLLPDVGQRLVTGTPTDVLRGVIHRPEYLKGSFMSGACAVIGAFSKVSRIAVLHVHRTRRTDRSNALETVEPSVRR
jgi:hypothetical protein